MSLIDTEIQNYLILSIVVLFVVTVVMLLVSRMRKNADFRSISQTFLSMGLGCIDEITIPDELDGYVTIDYCLLTPRGVVAIILQNYAGNLYGGDTIDSWTQVYQRKSFQFQNPHRHRQKCNSALQAFIPGVSVVSQIVFADIGVFPKGKPANVSMLSELKIDLKDFFEGEGPDEKTKLAWRKLEALKWSNADEKRAASINLD